MTEFLTALYPWTKSLHVISVIAWMAGQFYLPRLFVYHVERGSGSAELSSLFEVMERKLLRVIMNPAMIASWFFGILLALTPGVIDWTAVWPWTKLAGILGMSWFHGWCATQRKALAAGTNRISGKGYRLMNEVPTLLLVVIVFSVIARPF